MKAPLESDELTRQIIGAAMEVSDVLRPGMDERIYERAFEIELTLRGLAVTRQQSFPVIYKGEPIGTFVPDLIINDAIIVDLKVASAFNENHLAQMLGYLAITNLKVGLLFNFKHAKLEWKRVLAPA
jgi:GxxExxY protein